MDEAKIPTRGDISDSDTWDLTQLFADVGKWQEDFAWLQRTYPKLQEWKGRVRESAQTVAAVLEFEKSLDLKIERVYHFVGGKTEWIERGLPPRGTGPFLLLAGQGPTCRGGNLQTRRTRPYRCARRA